MKSMNLAACLAALTISAIAGCGGPPSDQPELVEVSGTVTVGGKPLANALVEFVPDAKGRPSTGTTDESGNYELQYTAEYSGVPAGSYTVTISLVQEEGNYEDNGEGGDSGLPASASDGSLKKTVEAGGGTIDIAL